MLYLTNKSNKKAKHFTVIGIINSFRDTICCVVIIEGKEELFYIRYGIDFSEYKVRDESDGGE